MAFIPEIKRKQYEVAVTRNMIYDIDETDPLIGISAVDGTSKSIYEMNVEEFLSDDLVPAEEFMREHYSNRTDYAIKPISIVCEIFRMYIPAWINDNDASDIIYYTPGFDIKANVLSVDKKDAFCAVDQYLAEKVLEGQSVITNIMKRIKYTPKVIEVGVDEFNELTMLRNYMEMGTITEK